MNIRELKPKSSNDKIQINTNNNMEYISDELKKILSDKSI